MSQPRKRKPEPKPAAKKRAATAEQPAGEPNRARPASRKASILRRGVAVSPGVAVGRAYCIHDIFVGDEPRPLDDAEVLNELSRFEAARDRTADDLEALYRKVAEQVGKSEAEIFLAHDAILRDPAFTAKVRTWIVESKHSAPTALQKLLGEYTELFAKTQDDFLRERLADIRDVIIRVSGHLNEAHDRYVDDDSDEPCILVAGELVPSHVITLGDRDVAGIVTEAGGRTSHAAILARSRGIPAVSGVEKVLEQVKQGDMIVVDGRDGHVIINPDYETLTAYRKLRREFTHLRETLAENHDQPAVSADGETVQLLANISGTADAKAAATMGASGVGLYRTEYLFLTHADVPSEEEQYVAYCETVAASPDRAITLRTLDVGGDKKIAYIGGNREANPFLGWRSIRISFEHPQFFLAQIRAVLRAAADDGGPPKRVRLMFPMVTTVEEMRKLRSFVHRAERQLAEKKIPFGKIPIGLMLEVPAAAVSIDVLLEETDFVSIGSNDLVQYLMAADRDNPKVSALCEPLSPAVIKVLAEVIAACRAADKPVTLCGEMAADPRAYILLFGMGLRSFSMSPAFVPVIKELLRVLTVPQTQAILKKALIMRTSGQIIRYMEEQLAEISPKLSQMG
jgi:phosphoenolpyruvate-protein phosphotransferase (PTS system enzyme I)